VAAGALVLAGGLALFGCSSSPSPAAGPTTTSTSSAVAPDTTAAPGPPCTKASITSAIEASPNNQLISVNGFGCAGGWAWAGVTVGPSAANSVDAVMVLSANGPAWQVADRATACSQHQVPASIYQDACTTS